MLQLTLLSLIGLTYIGSIIDYQKDNNSLTSLFLWLVSLVFVCLFILVRAKVEYKIFSNTTFFTNYLKSKYILILILAFGLFIRSWNITAVPILTHDEAKDAGIFPQKIISGELTDYFGFNAGINNFFFVLSSLPHYFIEDPIVKVRFLSVLFGTASLLLMYYFVARIASKRVALIATFFLAVYHVHIHFSRTEFLNLFDSFYALVILIAFYHFRKNQHVNSIIALAATLGFGLHFYSGLRAMILLAILSFCIVIATPFIRFVFQQKKVEKKQFREAVSSLIIFALFFVVALGPTIIVFKDRPHEALASGTATLVLNDDNPLQIKIGTIVENYKQSLLAYVYTPIDFHYRYGGPFLQIPYSIFFIIGFLLITVRIKHQTNLLIMLSLLGIPFLNSAILYQVNYTHRLMSLVPMIIITTALGVNFVSGIIRNYGGKNLSMVFVLLIATSFFIYNIALYFYHNIWEKTLFINEFRAWEAQKIITSAPKNSTVVFFLGNEIMPSYASLPPLAYLTEGYSIRDIINLQQLNELNSEIKDTALFIVLPENIAGVDISYSMSDGNFAQKVLGANTSFVQNITPNEKVYYKNRYLFDMMKGKFKNARLR